MKPVLSIRNFGFADAVRASKKRTPGMCSQILNWLHGISDGLRVRFGYGNYTNVTAPTGAEILKIGSIQAPSQEDVHVYFANDGSQKVYVNPIWQGSTKVSSNILINESKSFTGAGSVGAHTLTFTNADAVGLSTENDYYNNWMVKNSTQTEYGLITDYSYSAGTSVFTILERVDATGINWLATNDYILYRFNHDNPTFSPSYNTDLANPPTLNVQNSTLRWSGGQSSVNGNRGVIMFPQLNKTFFSTKAGTYLFKGSYISERELKSVDIVTNVVANKWTFGSISGVETELPSGKTYWLAIAPVYDGYQIGKLKKYESASDYGTTNYISTTGKNIVANLMINLGSLNKRITGFRVYIAQDDGDTTALGRQSEYFFVHYSDILNGTYPDWSLSNTSYYVGLLTIDGNLWSAKGSTYITESGIIETPLDTMYAYSTEEVVGLRRWLTNAYITSESFVERQQVLTNPLGGADFNGGIVAVDMFSNEDGVYRLRVAPTTGTKINGLVHVGLEDLVILKDRGVVYCRTVTTEDNLPELIANTISEEAGLCTPNQWTRSDEGWIYFHGYEDIYALQGSVMKNLIEDKDSQDWLYVYRQGLTKAQRESGVAFYLPQGHVIWDFQFNGGQFIFTPQKGWTQAAFKQSSSIAATEFFKWITRLQNGTVLGVAVNSSGTYQGIRQFQEPTTGALYWSDNGTMIRPKLDTGDLVVGDIDKDFLFSHVEFDKTIDQPTQGTLRCDVYRDAVRSTPYRAYEGVRKELTRIRLGRSRENPGMFERVGIVYNSDISPEGMNTGTIFQINGIDLYGETRDRISRVSEQISTLIGWDIMNSIDGRTEIIVNTTPQTFYFDNQFYNQVTNLKGFLEPAFKFDIWYAKVNQSDLENVEVVEIARTLNSVTLQSAQDNTLVKFSATEHGDVQISAPVSISGAYDLINTIAGKQEVMLGTDWQTFTWDHAFTKVYTDLNGNTVPAYRLKKMSAKSWSGANDWEVEVNIKNPTLSQITLRADEPLTLFKFEATE